MVLQYYVKVDLELLFVFCINCLLCYNSSTSITSIDPYSFNLAILNISRKEASSLNMFNTEAYYDNNLLKARKISIIITNFQLMLLICYDEFYFSLNTIANSMQQYKKYFKTYKHLNSL
ncbi:unnamed protein product [Paramecium octaurelia]|uniref:Uncharacterized protein n=1 Tax=Paramecium octaurelia TaxID=43137 RepID=A0A8S1V5N2_PAROT|nr:unnamed protein product [Paramecium octaurelia]